jgi:3-deoxy-D-manno-octulosonate 8-phosphate phosphatase KdsC-like HAD superfamily phosphatase
MRYLAVASSYEETIAGDGQIPAATLSALRRLVASGRQLVLLSRRTVEQLAECVPPDLFACVVAVPAGTNKATGLAAALGELGLSFHNVVGIGHAESDLAFLRRCECAVAISNSPQAVREQCDLVVKGGDGTAVTSLIGRLVGGDLADAEGRLDRHRLLLGEGESGVVAVQPYGANVLLAGSSGTGKSKLAAGLLERLAEHDYQFCVLDPEGDHAGLDGAVTLGDRADAPSVERIMTELKVPGRRVVANLLAVRLESRRRIFAAIRERYLTGRT